MIMVSFETTKEDAKLILQITNRAFAALVEQGVHADKMSVNMDITAVHANGNPLRLEDLLNADDFNFKHDIFGIYGKLDRTTGKLTGLFSPRFSARVA